MNPPASGRGGSPGADESSSPAADRSRRVSLGFAVERFRQSLFFLPALFIIGAVLLAAATVYLDGLVPSEMLPGPLTTTVESSRSILSAIAAGTITAASVVLSLTLVAVQLSSGQHSPRVLRNFIGDRFQQVTIGVVLGTFVYCVLILRAVRAPLEDSGDPIVPNISILVAIVFGIGALLAVLASVDHTASGLKVESIADQVTRETLKVIRERFPGRGEGGVGPAPQDPGSVIARTLPVDGSDRMIRSPATGWIRQMHTEAMLAAIPEGSTLTSRVTVGDYVMEGVPLFTLDGVGDVDDEEGAAIDAELCRLLDVGNERTMQQDLDFGILRLQDIGLRALSPGVNDPGTAVEIVARLGTILRELVGRDLDGRRDGPDGRRLELSFPPDYGTYLRASFDQMREAAGSQIVVHESMLRALGHLRDLAEQKGDEEARNAIHAAAREILDFASEHAPLERDRQELAGIVDRAGLGDD